MLENIWWHIRQVIEPGGLSDITVSRGLTWCNVSQANVSGSSVSAVVIIQEQVKLPSVGLPSSLISRHGGYKLQWSDKFIQVAKMTTGSPPAKKWRSTKDNILYTSPRAKQEFISYVDLHPPHPAPTPANKSLLLICFCLVLPNQGQLTLPLGHRSGGSMGYFSTLSLWGWN